MTVQHLIDLLQRNIANGTISGDMPVASATDEQGTVEGPTVCVETIGEKYYGTEKNVVAIHLFTTSGTELK